MKFLNPYTYIFGVSWNIFSMTHLLPSIREYQRRISNITVCHGISLTRYFHESTFVKLGGVWSCLFLSQKYSQSLTDSKKNCPSATTWSSQLSRPQYVFCLIVKTADTVKIQWSRNIYMLFTGWDVRLGPYPYRPRTVNNFFCSFLIKICQKIDFNL